MIRSGDAELQILAFLFFISILAQWAFMLSAPGSYMSAVDRQISDEEPLMKTDFITTHVEEQYMEQAVTDAVYTGMYKRGDDGFGPWDGDPPSWDEVSNEFDVAITSMMRNSYGGKIGSGSGCTIVGNNALALTLTDDETVFELSQSNPIYVICKSLHIAFSGQFESLTAYEQINVTGEYEVSGVRYRQMHETARMIGSGRTPDEIMNQYSDQDTVNGFNVSTEQDGGRVEVTITDTEHEIPTGDGLVNPVYRATYS